MIVFFLMIRRPPRSTRTDTLFPYTTLFRSAAPVAAARGESLSMLAPPPEPLSPFTLCETHGIFGLPGCRVRYSSAELGWSSLFLSEQDEARLCCKLRSAERRVGKECVGTCRDRGEPNHKQTNKKRHYRDN